MSNTKATNPKDIVSGNKLPLWLCSPVATAHWAIAQFSGMLKYGAWNWRVSGVRYSVYLSAMKRHIDAIASGETHDPVDGTDHLGNIMACAAIILDARAAGKLTDDRPPVVDHRPTYAECEAQMAVLREKYKDSNPVHYTKDVGVASPPVAPSGGEQEGAFFDFKDGKGPIPAHRHSNGGGWVADTATVDATVYVGPNAWVFDNAWVFGNARVYGNAWVCGNAWVGGEALVCGEARVCGEALVFKGSVTE